MTSPALSPFPLQRNLAGLYLVKTAKWMNLVMPIVVLFYQSNGMTMQEIFTLQAVYSATLMLLEIPTGYFADHAGRRTSILLVSLFGFGGYLLYSLSAGFWEFVMAETVLGVGMSLVSGADLALLYDSLLASDKAGRYTRYESRITSIGNFAEALAGIAGGLLAVASLRNYVNLLAPSETRVTILSVRNFIIRGLFALLGPLFGLITDRHGLTMALFAAGGLFSLMSGVTLFFFVKERTYERFEDLGMCFASSLCSSQ
jgi:MFS family permease